MKKQTKTHTKKPCLIKPEKKNLGQHLITSLLEGICDLRKVSDKGKIAFLVCSS